MVKEGEKRGALFSEEEERFQSSDPKSESIPSNPKKATLALGSNGDTQTKLLERTQSEKSETETKSKQRKRQGVGQTQKREM